MAHTTIIFQKDYKNPMNALMNWYDPNNHFNQQYYLNKVDKKVLYIRIYHTLLFNLVELDIKSYCKPFEESYYSNSYVRKEIDGIFKEEHPINISTIWSMQLFKYTPFSSTKIPCISSSYNDISSLYLTNANNYFFISQDISNQLYPLVVYASGTNLADVMLYNHNIESSYTGPSYEWYNDGPDNSYTPFTINNNLGSVFSWFFGVNSSNQVNNILTHTLLDICHNSCSVEHHLILIYHVFHDSSCDLSLKNDCSGLLIFKKITSTNILSFSIL